MIFDLALHPWSSSRSWLELKNHCLSSHNYAADVVKFSSRQFQELIVCWNISYVNSDENTEHLPYFLKVAFHMNKSENV